MNETSNPNPESGSHGMPNQSSQSSSGRTVFESLRDALNAGAREARAAAEKAAPKVKEALSDATYWTGYGASFAAVFSYTLVTELAPEVLKTGARDGAAAGRKAADDFASRHKPHGTEAAT
jgi:hypothetical protein